MAVKFKADKHIYESLDPNDTTQWTGVTTFIGQFKKPFDAKTISERSSKNKKSKWYGMDPLLIQSIWASESTRATDLGTWYHTQREEDLMACDTIQRGGINIPVIKSITDGEWKVAPEQRLTTGIYPEHFVYLKSAGICGQADRVEVINGLIDIIDYKTNKEIKKHAYKNWDGVTEKMMPPIDHVENCNYYHYALQLSMYMYIILKHNPTLKPGKLELHHITFKEKDQKDMYGNPVLYKDYDQNYIVHELIPYAVPYMKREVATLMEHQTKRNTHDQIIRH